MTTRHNLLTTAVIIVLEQTVIQHFNRPRCVGAFTTASALRSSRDFYHTAVGRQTTNHRLALHRRSGRSATLVHAISKRPSHRRSATSSLDAARGGRGTGGEHITSSGGTAVPNIFVDVRLASRRSAQVCRAAPVHIFMRQGALHCRLTS